MLMGKAMNRSITNVLFGAFGKVAAGPAGGAAAAAGNGASVRSITPEDVAVMLAYAQRVVVVPGYGLAVAQVTGAVVVLVSAPMISPVPLAPMPVTETLLSLVQLYVVQVYRHLMRWW